MMNKPRPTYAEQTERLRAVMPAVSALVTELGKVLVRLLS